jgi:hypothetical protein
MKKLSSGNNGSTKICLGVVLGMMSFVTGFDSYQTATIGI